MEPTAPIPQSPTGDAARRLSFLRSSTIALCFCLSTFGTASAVMSAPTPSQIPLFEESPIPTPPPLPRPCQSPGCTNGGYVGSAP